MGSETAHLEEVGKLRSAAAKELEAAEQDLASAQRRCGEARERLRLLDRLLSVEQAPTADEGSSPQTDSLLDECERIILEAGKPIHIRELHATLIRRGVPLPGRGLEANLIVRLQRSNGRFLRVGRGTYAPALLGHPETKPTRKRRIVQGK